MSSPERALRTGQERLTEGRRAFHRLANRAGLASQLVVQRQIENLQKIAHEGDRTIRLALVPRSSRLVDHNLEHVGDLVGERLIPPHDLQDDDHVLAGCGRAEEERDRCAVEAGCPALLGRIQHQVRDPIGQQMADARAAFSRADAAGSGARDRCVQEALPARQRTFLRGGLVPLCLVGSPLVRVLLDGARRVAVPPVEEPPAAAASPPAVLGHFGPLGVVGRGVTTESTEDLDFVVNVRPGVRQGRRLQPLGELVPVPQWDPAEGPVRVGGGLDALRQDGPGLGACLPL